MTSEFENFEIDCEITVFPQPNAPGIAAVEPYANGNRPSRTRCPVMRGQSEGIFSAYFAGDLTGCL